MEREEEGLYHARIMHEKTFIIIYNNEVYI